MKLSNLPLADRSIVQAYLTAASCEARAKERREELGPQVLAIIGANGGSIESGRNTLSTRTATKFKFSPNVERLETALKALREEEKGNGSATASKTSHLVFSK